MKFNHLIIGTYSTDWWSVTHKQSSIASAVVPPEEGVYRFRYKEDEETPLPIIPSGSCGITVTKADIDTLCCEGIAVNNDNDPAPENVMKSDDVLTNL